MKQKQYNQLIATNLKSKIKEIAKHPPPISGFKISRLKYLIHLILSHKQDKHRGAYSVLNMQYMKKIIPSADKYLNFLKDEGIVEWKNYSAGRNSRLYRLTNEGKTEFQTIIDHNLIRRIEKSRKYSGLHNSRKYPHLNKFIHRVKIDFKGALKTIEGEYLKAPDKQAAERRRTFCLAEVEKIRSGEIFISVNDTNYRLDSNFTRLPSTLLRHLSIDGYPLIEMDISNSQPFLAASLFEPTPEVEKIIEKYLPNYTMNIKELQLIKYEDVRQYKLLVSTGKFYNFMAKKFKENNIPYTNQKDLKQQLFVVFFGKRNADKYNKAAKVFKETFPNVQRLFDLVKKEEYNHLAILLQRIESYIILEKVVKKIVLQIPTLPILTRHDSVIPFKQSIYVHENMEKVSQIILNTTEEVTGIRPQGKMKRYI